MAAKTVLVSISVLAALLHSLNLVDAHPVTVVSRSQWGACSAESVTPLVTPVSKVIIHHTVTPRCWSLFYCSRRVKIIQDYHMDTKGWSDIGYNFLVGNDGRVYEGRGWDREGAHARGHNSESIGIAFVGDYSQYIPPQIALDAAKNLISLGIANGKITSTYSLYGHRNVGSTECPGNNLYSEIQTWARFSG